MDLRLVAAEGDSVDGTRERIKELSNEYNIPLTITDTTHGHMKWASVEDPVRMRTMSDVMNKALDEVRDSDDVVVWIMSDLEWKPKDICFLVRSALAEKEGYSIFAPEVRIKSSGQFYDTWAFRHFNGTRFDAKFNPSTVDADFITISSAGSCLVMNACVAKHCRADKDEAVSFCKNARNKYNIALAANVQIYHAPPAPYRVLWISDAVCISGFSRVAHAMFPILAESGYDIDIVALNYWGTPHNYPYTIYPANVTGDDPSGNLRTKMLIAGAHNTGKPYDLIIKLDDPWNIRGLTRELEDLETNHKIPSPPVIAWVTVDGKNVKGEELNSPYILHVISATRFGMIELESKGYSGQCSCVPFGVDTSIYHPLDKLHSRSLVSSEEISNENAFIVGVVSTNQLRKRLDLVLEYFSHWIDQYKVPNAYLYLCLGQESNSGCDLESLVHYYGLQKRVIVNTSLLSDYTMAHVYNSFDVFLSLSSEGFGLCALEAMACGVPCIVSDWSGYGSWIPEDVAIKIHCSSTFLSAPLNSQAYVIGGVADKHRTVAALAKLYTFEEMRGKLRERGLELAKSLSWKSTGEGLLRVMEDVISKVKVKISERSVVNE